MSAPDVITMGCRLNIFESEVIRGHADRAGLDDAIIVNTCAVTAEAERQARQTIRRARRENPAKRIIVTGCAAQLDPAGFNAMDEVDHVIGNEEKMQAATFANLNGETQVRVADIMTVRETAPHLVKGFDGRVRAFVQIQQGCDHRCTFCIIPFARGNNRSVPLDAIIEQTRTHGVPALLVHCAMHTFWATFGTPDSRGAEKQPELQANWLAKNPNTPFPNWSDFSGLNTKVHDHQVPLTVRRAEPVHPAAKNFPAEWLVVKDELYQNVEFKKTATPIRIAYSTTSQKDHVLAWENKVGNSHTIGITLGHGMETFTMPSFHQFLANSILHLAGKLDAEGMPVAGFAGRGK